ncbi:DMT family transporter [Halochromatium roseum]|uniref:DMT family transporter n=1 Tax=Halochromatium roseum TaxID=391920 RepID=UPI0019121C71|nr:SMR family transporter [Halochromatium roseum]MBK5938259.1 QacE family quaternary ammonium compound efflux SMR transporter [Halochromatium roseum]
MGEQHSGYLYLAVAIVAEVIATNALKASDGFTKLVPSLVVVMGYGAAFYLLALVLKTIPVGLAYAIWAGLGIVLVALAAAVMFRQIPDLPAVIGMALIIAGVIVISAFSKTTGH